MDVLCGTTAWAIARCKQKFFKFCYVYFIVGILIPYQALFLPIYIIGYNLNLTNTRIGIILMYVATGISFGVFLMNSFMSTVPIELEEAARIDGCSILRTYFSVVLPLLKPAMAAIVISVLPIAILFIALQKYFIKGMTVGAVKG